MIRPTVLYYDVLQFQAPVVAWLEAHADVRRLGAPGDERDEDLAGLDAVFAPRGYTFDDAWMRRCPRLRVIASPTLAVPHVDTVAAAARGVSVVCLGGQTDVMRRITATAELSWALTIAITRHLPWAHAAACAGQWGGRPWGRRTPRMLSAMTLGVVGMGRLGRMVANYGRAFGMPVYYYSPRSTDDAATRVSTLHELAAAADIVSVHANHTAETTSLIDDAFFGAMRPGSFLVNTSRGELIDEGALLRALESGRLAGAALDVLAGCTAPGFGDTLATHPVLQYARAHENLIVTPHYAGATLDAWMATERRICELLLGAFGAGESSNG